MHSLFTLPFGLSPNFFKTIAAPSVYPQWVTCATLGATHVYGFSRNVFEFNGLGDFDFVIIGDYTIQIRLELCGQSSCVTAVLLTFNFSLFLNIFIKRWIFFGFYDCCIS